MSCLSKAHNDIRLVGWLRMKGKEGRSRVQSPLLTNCQLTFADQKKKKKKQSTHLSICHGNKRNKPVDDEFHLHLFWSLFPEMYLLHEAIHLYLNRYQNAENQF